MPYGSATIAEEIRKTKSVILGKKKDRDGSASVKSRPQQPLMSRNEVCDSLTLFMGPKNADFCFTWLIVFV